MQAALETLGTGRTQLVVAHRLSTIAGATQILVLASGRLVERGTHSELLRAEGLYSELWNTQVEASRRSEAKSEGAGEEAAEGSAKGAERAGQNGEAGIEIHVAK